jgi:hypothetical protein
MTLRWFDRLTDYAKTLLESGAPAVLAGDFNGGNPRWREPRPCSSWGQVAHVLTPDNFRLSPGKKDFTAPQGLRTSLPRSLVRSNSERCGSPFLFDRVKKLASAAIAEDTSVLVYVAYSDRVIEGSPKNSIAANTESPVG